MKNEISNIKIEDDIVIVDGFAFEIDRSIPTIGKYVGEEKELTFPKVQLSKSIAEDLQTATITIKAKEEKNGINKIVIMQRGFIIETFTYDNEKEEITIDYDKITRNGKYTVKVYGALSASAIIEIEGLVPSIEYTPIGNLEYKKEHQVKILVKEAGDKVASIKYQWSNELTEPEDNTFTKTCNREETIIQTGVTVDWYLWTLLETESGFKRKERSETFKFDNQGPTVTLTSMPVSETEFTLTATAEDEHTAPKECKFYVGGELKETKDISSGTASYDVTVESMGDNYNCYVIVTDTLGNETKQTVTSKTKMHTWDKWNINTTTTYAEGSWSSWKMLDKVIGDNTCARESYSFDKNTGMYTTKRRRNSTH